MGWLLLTWRLSLMWFRAQEPFHVLMRLLRWVVGTLPDRIKLKHITLTVHVHVHLPILYFRMHKYEKRVKPINLQPGSDCSR